MTAAMDWVDLPHDLDLHIRMIDANSKSICHSYYNKKRCETQQGAKIELDVDNVSVS